jgi:hypothetical protein
MRGCRFRFVLIVVVNPLPQLTKNPLEPLLLCIAREFSDNQDLSEKIQTIYQVHTSSKGIGR